MFSKPASVFSLLTLACLVSFTSSWSAPEQVASRSNLAVDGVIQSITPPSPPAMLGRNNKTAESTSDTASHYPVFFVSNRRPKEKNGETKFGNVRSSELNFGEYLPSQDNESIEEAKMLRFQSEKEFLNALKATGSKKVAFFVHGYRKSFVGSMDFGLKMAKHLDAPLVVFAWPSKNNYCAYMIDECTAEWSSHQLSRMLGDLGDSVGFHNVVIVSHSLGARMVQWALRDLYTERRPAEQFGAALFFSPDVDRDSFLQDSHFLKQACADCRIYLGSHDTRIRISKLLHGSPRVGSGSKDRAVTELSQIFRYDDSLPSHQIPFDLVANSVHQITEAENNN